LLEREQREKAQELIKDIEVGKKFSAVITRVTDFGAFADIGGIEGLIPRSEISYGHIERISDVISSNDRVEVLVLNFEPNEEQPNKSRLSFSLKKAKEDPYVLHWAKLNVGATVEGRVVRLESFGAFIELFPGIDGLVHISELSESRVTHPKEVLSIGEPVSVRVLSVNDAERRIGLSLREAVTKKKSSDTKESHIKLERGQKASGVISRIERYGVFLELDNGSSALLPESETGLPRHSDLSRAFKLGDSLDVAIIDIDHQNRIRVSLLARKSMEERDSYLDFQAQETKRTGSFGSLADLIKKRH
jgi:small subunit ribosomal protein S1